MTPQRLSDFLPLAAQSLTQPRATLKHILAVPATRQDIITAGWLVIVLSLMLSQIFAIMMPETAADPTQSPPLTAAIIVSAATVFGGGFLVYQVGQWFGGEGSFDNSLRTVVWFNFILLFLQIPIPFAASHSDAMMALVIMLVFIITMIQVTAQVMELHGFTKVLPVLVGVIGAQFFFGLLLIALLAMLGVTIPTEPVN